MNGIKSHTRKDFVRKKKHVVSLGDCISPHLLRTKPKNAKHQVVKEKDDAAVELNRFDPFSVTAECADAAIIRFLKKVKKFQDRSWKKNPIKACDGAKSKHRLVYGLREVRKQLLLETVRCVILARDTEIHKSVKFAAEIDIIKEICASNQIDILWISSKHDLGKAVNKWPIVSAVAILDYCGAEDVYSAAIQTFADFMAYCRIADHAHQPSLFA
uniref:Ribosomal_L7Ae domain-containing protein n=1 Tax=Elaeophora elaphi TaxID=1147741 RepID=A0A0R3S6U4_9BILA